MSREKEWVRDRYSAVATGRAGGCCGKSEADSDSAARVAETIGYGVEELGAVPEGANLGLGCGNPVALASIAAGETVLDLGSGAGFDAFLAAARVGPTGRVIGVDMTPDMIERARANAERSGHTNVEFRHGDIEALPVGDASADLVISNCVLNLVPDKAKAFREIVRVLKPSGRVAISDIVLDAPLPAQLRDDAAAYCSCISGAIARADYLRALEAAGLIEVRVVSEADAAELLAGGCCGLSVDDLAGVVTSISVTGRKPAPCCS
jgi:SAM-dependent methyltransferase